MRKSPRRIDTIKDASFYIIRYYPDPEASFDGAIRRLFQAFGESNLLERLARALASQGPEERDRTIDIASGHEMRLALRGLADSSGGTDSQTEAIALFLDWLVGLRLVKRHREVLRIQFRLDTVEAKTQALRDVVFVSSHLGLLKGIFLLLDELEKQDVSVSKVVLLRYLFAIRALIDALPRHLFLLVALTKDARYRYFQMVPALAGRLQNSISLEPLKDEQQAMALSHFYVEKAAEEGLKLFGVPAAGQTPVVTDVDVSEAFRRLYKESADRGLEGVSQRDFLNELYAVAERRITS